MISVWITKYLSLCFLSCHQSLIWLLNQMLSLVTFLFKIPSTNLLYSSIRIDFAHFICIVCLRQVGFQKRIPWVKIIGKSSVYMTNYLFDKTVILQLSKQNRPLKGCVYKSILTYCNNLVQSTFLFQQKLKSMFNMTVFRRTAELYMPDSSIWTIVLSFLR